MELKDLNRTLEKAELYLRTVKDQMIEAAADEDEIDEEVDEDLEEGCKSDDEDEEDDEESDDEEADGEDEEE